MDGGALMAQGSHLGQRHGRRRPQEGAREFGLSEGYTAWLAGMRGIDSKERGDEYYSTEDGSPLEGMPKIRVGGTDGGGRGSGRRRQRGQRHEGGAPSRGGSREQSA